MWYGHLIYRQINALLPLCYCKSLKYKNVLLLIDIRPLVTQLDEIVRLSVIVVGIVY